jgi:hypothetical protein
MIFEPTKKESDQMKIGYGYSNAVPSTTDPETYTITTYDATRRYRRAATVFIPVLACTVGFWYLQYHNHALQDGWWFPTIILLIGAAFAFLRLMESRTNKAQTTDF